MYSKWPAYNSGDTATLCYFQISLRETFHVHNTLDSILPEPKNATNKR